MTEVADWLVAFAITCAIELAIAVPMLRAAEPRALHCRVVLVLFANLFAERIRRCGSCSRGSASRTRRPW